MGLLSWFGGAGEAVEKGRGDSIAGRHASQVRTSSVRPIGMVYFDVLMRGARGTHARGYKGVFSPIMWRVMALMLLYTGGHSAELHSGQVCRELCD